ncbi:hypothetical protein [Micromonospora sp. NPDC050200]|uniref:hypothetical protein n=1 Tax=Micromonospora sp. NPDC050200 TaxID=3155664 RepID=UPI0033E88D92
MTAAKVPTGIADVHAAVERLRESWTWLGLLVTPGPERRPGRAVDEQQAEVLEARGRSDRAYRAWNLARGMTALAPSAAAARLDVVDAQAAVHRAVTGLADRVASYRASSYVGRRTGAVDAVADVLDWLTAGGPGRPWVATAGGEVWRAGVVDELHEHRDAHLLTHIHRVLTAAGDTARAAAGVVAEAVQPLAHRCPACRHRSLQLHHEGRDKSRWTVRCVRRPCLCTGEGCGCLRRDRRPGLAHVWTRGELDGQHGLATAVAIAQRLTEQGSPRPRVATTSAGHGGWAERRRA